MGQQRLFRGVTPYLFVAPAVGILAFTCLYPVIKGFELSFYDWSLGTPISSRKYVGWENFAWAWQDPALFNSIKVTLVFTACSVLAELFLGLAIAFLLEKGVRGIAIFRTIFIVPIMIAPVVVGLLWRYLFDANFGLINYLVRLVGFEPKIWLGTPGLAMPAVIVTDIWQWTPFMFILFLAGLQSLPKDPVEAAEVDGASGWQVIRLVKLPLLAPVTRTFMRSAPGSSGRAACGRCWPRTCSGLSRRSAVPAPTAGRGGRGPRRSRFRSWGPARRGRSGC